MTDFAALVAELKDAALDAGATWDRCSDEFQKTLETRLHEAERALLAAPPPPPAGAVGGGGGGSGDLGALSAGATPGPWYVESEKTDGTYGAGEDCSEGYDVSTICTEAERPYGMPGVLFESHNSTVGLIEEESDEDRFHAWDAVSKANAEFVVAIVNAYRSGHLVEASAPNPDLGAQGEPVWVKKYKAECQRSGADFDAEACITENFPQIVTPQQPAAQGELVGREAVLAVVRAAWALVDNTGHHDLLPLAINRDDWNDLAARLAALKALLPAEELPADAPHAVVYFWPASSSIGTESAPDPGAQGEPVAWDRYTVLNADHRRRIQALGAAISLRDWFGVEKAHAEIRDAFDRPDIYDPTSTDNLRSRNRPAAWAYEYLASDGWQRALWWDCPSELPQYKSRPERYRNVRPLGFLGEASTPPSGVETIRQDSEGDTDA